MSCTKSSFSSLRLQLSFFFFILSAVPLASVWPQAVPSQANIDASAQRRLQETAREAQRQHRMDQEIRKLSAALSPEKLTGPTGPVLTRRALAALSRLRADGISPEEALARAARTAGPAGATSKPSAYLRNLFAETSAKITPSSLSKLEAGEDPAPALIIPPYQP
ncbi:MAG: hypothetical protein RLZZ112_992 [Verrucomicrobiota bacterium]|jgi:hypothetical protein